MQHQYGIGDAIAELIATSLDLFEMLIDRIVCGVRGHRWYLWQVQSGYEVRTCERCGGDEVTGAVTEEPGP